MQTINLRSTLQALLFCAVLLATGISAGIIYRDIKQVCSSQPSNAGITCFFDMLQ